MTRWSVVQAYTRRVASSLSRCRVAAGLTVLELSRRTGIPHKSLSLYEYGTAWPTTRRLAIIADALRVDLGELVA